MAIDWVRMDTSLPTHRKSIVLGKLLGAPRAWSYPAQLWMWARANAPKGAIHGAHAVDQVEVGAGWDGEPGKLCAALIASGFLDRKGDGADLELRLHNWKSRNGTESERANRHAERQRRYREKQAARDVTGDITVTSPNVTRDPHVTRRNETRQLPTSKETDTAPEAPAVTPRRKRARGGDAAQPSLPIESDAQRAQPVTSRVTPGDASRDADRDVYQAWRQYWSPRSPEKPPPKSLAIIGARRAERPPETAQEDLLTALEGWALDPWPDRGQQCAVKILFRDADQVAKGLNFAATGPRKVGPDGIAFAVVRVHICRGCFRSRRGDASRLCTSCAPVEAAP